MDLKDQREVKGNLDHKELMVHVVILVLQERKVLEVELVALDKMDRTVYQESKAHKDRKEKRELRATKET